MGILVHDRMGSHACEMCGRAFVCRNPKSFEGSSHDNYCDAGMHFMLDMFFCSGCTKGIAAPPEMEYIS